MIIILIIIINFMVIIAVIFSNAFIIISHHHHHHHHHRYHHHDHQDHHDHDHHHYHCYHHSRYYFIIVISIIPIFFTFMFILNHDYIFKGKSTDRIQYMSTKLTRLLAGNKAWYKCLKIQIKSLILLITIYCCRHNVYVYCVITFVHKSSPPSPGSATPKVTKQDTVSAMELAEAAATSALTGQVVNIGDV